MSSTVLSSKSGLKPEIANPVEPLRPFFPTKLVVSLTAAALSKLFLKSISKGEQVRRRPFMEAPSHRASALVAPWGVNELPSILQVSSRRTEASVSLIYFKKRPKSGPVLAIEINRDWASSLLSLLVLTGLLRTTDSCQYCLRWFHCPLPQRSWLTIKTSISMTVTPTPTWFNPRFLTADSVCNYNLIWSKNTRNLVQYWNRFVERSLKVWMKGKGHFDNF